MIYHIIDHTDQLAEQVRYDEFSAKYAAFNFARDLIVQCQRRVHLSVIDEQGRQLLDIKANQREG